jgi:hypothetical protein
VFRGFCRPTLSTINDPTRMHHCHPLLHLHVLDPPPVFALFKRKLLRAVAVAVPVLGRSWSSADWTESVASVQSWCASCSHAMSDLGDVAPDWHGTAVVSWIVGRTLRVAPDARIHLFQVRFSASRLLSSRVLIIASFFRKTLKMVCGSQTRLQVHLKPACCPTRIIHLGRAHSSRVHKTRRLDAMPPFIANALRQRCSVNSSE